MSTFVPSDLLTAWSAQPEGVVLCALAALSYVLLLRRAARAGLRTPRWRVALYALLGVGTLLGSEAVSGGEAREPWKPTTETAERPATPRGDGPLAIAAVG